MDDHLWNIFQFYLNLGGIVKGTYNCKIRWRSKEHFFLWGISIRGCQITLLRGVSQECIRNWDFKITNSLLLELIMFGKLAAKTRLSSYPVKVNLVTALLFVQCRFEDVKEATKT